MLKFENPIIHKVLHNLATEPCVECGKFYDLMFVVMETPLIFKEWEEVYVCPSCFNFQYILNPSKRGDSYH